MPSFEEALAESEGMPRSLLLGNGFSQACPEGGDFAWDTLVDRSGIDVSSETGKLFQILSTSDFERVLRHIDSSVMTARLYGQNDFAESLMAESAKVRDGLIRAIRSVHPERGDNIPRDSLERCSEFISKFDRVYTLNYDLLLYWVLQEQASRDKHDDGFRRPGGGKLVFTQPDYATIFHLHGALHIFEEATGQITKASPQNGRTLFGQIEHLIEEKSKVPIYISEGDSHSKRSNIELNKYTRNAYSKLKSESGVMFLFGASLNDNDDHIVDAIKHSNINHVYACIHDFTTSLTAKNINLISKFDGANVGLTLLDSATAPVW